MVESLLAITLLCVIRAETFNENEYKTEFAAAISPADIGMIVEPIREQGVHAAQNGTDFSGLFIGLSFFILVASIIFNSPAFSFEP